MVRWREVNSLKIKALTSYSATLFDLKNKKCILREGANLSCGGGVFSRTQRLGGGTPSHGDFLDSFPYETTPYRTNC